MKGILILSLILAIIFSSGCIGGGSGPSETGTVTDSAIDSVADSTETGTAGVADSKYDDATVIEGSDEDAVLAEERAWIIANACKGEDRDGIVGSKEGSPEENWSIYGPDSPVQANGHYYHEYSVMCYDLNYEFYEFQVDSLYG